MTRYAEARDKRTEEWIERQVTPYLQELLDRAQARLGRHQIAFDDGMGMSTFYVEGTSVNKEDLFDTAIGAAAAVKATSYEPVGGRHLEKRYRRYARRFPELVEFKVITNDLDEYLGQCVGRMESTATVPSNGGPR